MDCTSRSSCCHGSLSALERQRKESKMKLRMLSTVSFFRFLLTATSSLQRYELPTMPNKLKGPFTLKDKV